MAFAILGDFNRRMERNDEFLALLPGEPARRPYEIAMNCWKKGFYVRYGGDTVQLAPPFISERAEIDRLVNALGDALAETA